jgi:hypothetical protein
MASPPPSLCPRLLHVHCVHSVCCGGITASPPPSICPRLLHVHCVHCVLRRHHGLSASLTLSSFTTRAQRALCAAVASRPLRLLHSVLVYYTCTGSDRSDRYRTRSSDRGVSPVPSRLVPDRRRRLLSAPDSRPHPQLANILTPNHLAYQVFTHRPS